MLFQGRFEKQLQRIKERRGETSRAYDEKDVRNVMEKNDLLAMILSALIVILPAALLFLLIISAIGFFFIVR